MGKSRELLNYEAGSGRRRVEASWAGGWLRIIQRWETRKKIAQMNILAQKDATFCAKIAGPARLVAGCVSIISSHASTSYTPLRLHPLCRIGSFLQIYDETLKF